LSYTCDELGYVFYDDWDPEYYSDEGEWTYDDEWSYDDDWSTYGDDSDMSSGDDEPCYGVFVEEGDCMETFDDEGVDMTYMESCTYSYEIDTCSDDEGICNMSISFMGQTYEGLCEEIAE